MTLDRSKIIKDFKNKISILKKHNHYYYNKDNPKITDSDYDELKKELFLMEKSYNFLKKLDLLSKMVGSPPLIKFSKITHLRPILSLSNAFDRSKKPIYSVLLYLLVSAISSLTVNI